MCACALPFSATSTDALETALAEWPAHLQTLRSYSGRFRRQSPADRQAGSGRRSQGRARSGRPGARDAGARPRLFSAAPTRRRGPRARGPLAAWVRPVTSRPAAQRGAAAPVSSAGARLSVCLPPRTAEQRPGASRVQCAAAPSGAAPPQEPRAVPSEPPEEPPSARGDRQNRPSEFDRARAPPAAGFQSDIGLSDRPGFLVVRRSSVMARFQ